MSNVQVYAKSVLVESLSGAKVFESNTERSVILNDVDASDFISEFTVDEILSAMDFADVADWVNARREDEDDIDFSEAE